MTAFLTKAELKQLTGFAHALGQKNWLAQEGWIFRVNSKGCPVVGRAYCDMMMAGGRSPGMDIEPQPKFSKVL